MQIEDLSQYTQKQEDLISQSQLAKVLNVDRSAISHALRRGSLCAGIDLRKCAVYDENGNFLGFSKKLLKLKKIRSNPDKGYNYIQKELKKPIDTGLILAGVSQVPVLINSFNQVHEDLRLPVMSMFSALLLGSLGYFTGSEGDKGKYAMIGAGIGALIPVVSTFIQQKNVRAEDRAMVGTNPSADSNAKTRLAGDVNPQQGFSDNIKPLVFAQKAINP